MVSTDINGLFIANAIPLAVETPIRSPVNEPGPDAIQTPSKFVKEISFFLSRLSISMCYCSP